MPRAFDPYHTWLGIPPEEQPPDHYCLLGLRPLEQNLVVIENAADQRMTHLRTFQTGRHAELSQKLLNEVAAARVCLLNPDRKAAYDRQLRQKQPADAEKPPHVGATTPPRKTLAQELAGTGRQAARPASLGQLGEYRLLEKLGEGGMGTVYRALHTKLGREVALKVLAKGRVEDPRAIARFEREMMAVGALDHTNIVRAMDARIIDGTRFLVMEFVKGLDLAKVIRRLGPLSVADACELVRQAALGLQCAHEHKLVHRDVKPSNLMLTPQGQVKLLDLGLARFQSDQPIGEEVTASGQPVGTVDYMAPEQVSDTHTVDIRADIYGLGCTLYKLLTGRVPFGGPEYDTHFSKMQGHLQKSPPPIRRFRRDVPKQLIAVVNRMLAKKPDQRFATPAEVADAVGPLATTSDLPSLLAMVEGQPTAVARLGEAFTSTQATPSASALTRFFRQIGSDSHRPVSQPPVPSINRRVRLAIVLGCVVVGLLSVAILIAWAMKSGSAPADVTPTEMVFDWPPESREQTTLFIDRRPFEFPASGPLVVPCKPGKYRIHVFRDGFHPNEKQVTVGDGVSQRILPFDTWTPESEVPPSHVVIRWRQDERNDAQLEIDDQVCGLSGPNVEVTPDHVKVRMEAGAHKLWIARRGFAPFEQELTIAAGEDQIVDVVWGPPTSGSSAGQVKHPVPSPAEQQQAAVQIEVKYGPAKAETAEQKAKLAGRWLREGKQAADPAEQFVLFQQALVLAIEAGNAALLLEAVDAMGAHFKVDPVAKKQEALAEYVKTSTPLPVIHSLIEADKFAKAAAGSPKIASLAEAVGQVAVGDAYWDLSQMERAQSQEALMLCAGRWYGQAPPGLTSGPGKDKYKFRLAQIAQVETVVQQAHRGEAYPKTLEPAEAMVAAWDFLGAKAALAKLKFEGQELAARLAGRRNDVELLAGLKTKMIAKINTAQPRLRKSSLMLRGIDGDLVAADEKAITANPGARKTEALPWQSLSQKSVQRLLSLVVDRQSADDWRAAGLLALVGKDATSAAKYFEQARSLGASIDRYRDQLAEKAFEQATDLLDKKEFREAESQLTDVEKKYGQTPWYASHQQELEAARDRLRAGIVAMGEAEAEKLYAGAAELFKRGRYFELKPLMLKFKDSYPNAAVITDPDRTPTFAEMQAVIDNLGRSVTIRQDGRGDFRTIQKAILAVPPNSTIEIQDNGAYNEEIVIPAEKSGLTLRGGPGFWPMLTTAGLKTTPGFVMAVRADRTTIERLILLNAKMPRNCVLVEGGSLRADTAILGGTQVSIAGRGQNRCELHNCVTIGAWADMRSVVARNCILLKGGLFGWTFDLSNVVAAQLKATGPSQLQFCTITGPVRFEAQPNTLLDSIVNQVESLRLETRIENCNVFSNNYLVLAKPGKGCFSGNPNFRDPNGLDFRLAPTSPCRKKASDGGDLGCRHTPEMMELLKLTFELRRRGIITIPPGG